MILDITYEKQWLEQKAKELVKGDAKLLEKAVMALCLLEQLKLKDVELVFKGGTSLILLLEEPRRFSIDIDLIIKEKPKNINSVFDTIVKESPFTRWIPDNDRKTAINAPVEHYKFYYNSVVDSYFGEEPILLDLLYDEHYYNDLHKTPIKHKWLKTAEPHIIIPTPSPEDILGDKLTAFAPNTTGILYEKNKPVEIIKQLYDIGSLFDVVKNISVVKKTFNSIAKAEGEYRNINISPAQVLDDIFETAFMISMRDVEDKNFQHLQKGVSNIYNFIFIEKFKIESAITCASKAAYISQLIKQGAKQIDHRFSGPEEIKDWSIENLQYNKLNRLKKLIPEAFYYWYHALNL